MVDFNSKDDDFSYRFFGDDKYDDWVSSIGVPPGFLVVRAWFKHRGQTAYAEAVVSREFSETPAIEAYVAGIVAKFRKEN